MLFSVQKGLFFWSPLLLAAIAGFVVGDRKKLPFLAGTAVVMAVDTYLIASWWDWQFGASYGHRGFIDILPLLAFGLAAFFEWSATRRRQADRRCRAGICGRRTVGVPDAAVLERRAANGRHDVGPISRDLSAAALIVFAAAIER